MDKWARELSDLLPRFRAHADADLNVIGAIARLGDPWPSGDDPIIRERHVPLPDDDYFSLAWGDGGWRSGKPLIPDRDVIKFCPYDPTRPIYDSGNACVSRLVLFGYADVQAVDLFMRLATQASRCLRLRSGSLDRAWPYHWIEHLLDAAIRRPPASMLSAEVVAHPLVWIGDGPRWTVLTDLFQSSVHLINYYVEQATTVPDPTPAEAMKAASEKPLDWIVASKRKLSWAVGYSETNDYILDKLRDEGVIELEVRGKKLAIRFPNDPKRHAAAETKIAGLTR